MFIVNLIKIFSVLAYKWKLSLQAIASSTLMAPLWPPTGYTPVSIEIWVCQFVMQDDFVSLLLCQDDGMSFVTLSRWFSEIFALWRWICVCYFVKLCQDDFLCLLLSQDDFISFLLCQNLFCDSVTLSRWFYEFVTLSRWFCGAVFALWR